MRTTCSPNVHVTTDTPLLAAGVISDAAGQMGSVPSGEDPRLREEIFIEPSPHRTQNVLITLPGWGLNGGSLLLSIRMAVSALACSLLDVISGLLAVCCPPPCAQLLFPPGVGQVLGAQQLLEHGKSIYILT